MCRRESGTQFRLTPPGAGCLRHLVRWSALPFFRNLDEPEIKKCTDVELRGVGKLRLPVRCRADRKATTDHRGDERTEVGPFVPAVPRFFISARSRKYTKSATPRCRARSIGRPARYAARVEGDRDHLFPSALRPTTPISITHDRSQPSSNAWSSASSKPTTNRCAAAGRGIPRSRRPWSVERLDRPPLTHSSNRWGNTRSVSTSSRENTVSAVLVGLQRLGS